MKKDFICWSLLVLLIIGSFAPFATAEFSNPTSEQKFGNQNKWQANNPTLDNYYKGSIDTYWPILNRLENDDCSGEGNTDFIVAIPPAGCSPKVVRSDLLAEQNVPVFCQLSAIKVNPLIDVSTIKSISFKGDYPENVAGISFHPARAAVGSMTTLVNDPIEQNIGYVVVVLKRTPNETSLEEFVSGMLTATINYDSKTAFGTGAGDYYLEPMLDFEWQKRAPESSFWGGKGYLRATKIEDNSVTVDVMSSKENVIDTVTIREGDISSPVYYPGQYCTSSVELKLNKIDASQDMARLNIDGDNIWVRRGTRLFDGKCVVSDVKIFDDGSGEVVITCTGRESFVLKIGRNLGVSGCNINEDSRSFNYPSYDYGEWTFTALNSTYIKSTKITSGSKTWWYTRDGQEWDYHDPSTGAKDKVTAVTETLDEDTKKNGKSNDQGQASYESFKRQANAVAEIARCMDGGVTSGDIDFAFDDWKCFAIETNKIKGISENGDIVYFERKLGEWKVIEDGKEMKYDNFKNSRKISENYEEFSIKANRAIAAFTGLIDTGKLSSGKYLKSSDVSKYAKLAEEATLELVETYPYEEKGNGEYFGEESLSEQIKLAGEMEDSSSQMRLAELFMEKYQESAVFEDTRDLTIQLQNYNFDGSSKNILVNNANHNIKLEGFSKGGGQTDSVNVRLDGGKLVSLKRDKVYDGGTWEEIVTGSEDEVFPRLAVESIGNGGARFSYYWKDSDGNSKSEKSFMIANGQKYKSGGLEIFVVDTQIREVAHISLIPNINNEKAEANFTFNIGIEKRAQELNPDKANKKIKELNKSIVAWEKRLDSLGKFVGGMKTACVGVSGVLALKSMLSGSSGSSIARSQVMDFYEEECRKEYSTSELNKCYSENSGEIESAVEGYASAIDAVNKRVKCARTDSTTKSGFFESKVIDSKGYVSELSKCVGLDNWGREIDGINLEKKDLVDARDYQAVLLVEEACKDENSVACKIAEEKMRKVLDDNICRVKVKEDSGDSREEIGVKGVPLPLNFRANVVRQQVVQVGENSNTLMSSENYVTRVYNPTVNKNNEIIYVEVSPAGNVVDLYDESGIFIEENSESLKNKIASNYQFVIPSSDEDGCSNKIIDPYVRFYEEGNVQGFVGVVPFDLNEGWYSYVDARDYSESGEAEAFWICNVGTDGKMSDGPDGGDVCVRFSVNSGSNAIFTACPEKSSSQITGLYNKAQKAIREVNRDGNGINVDGVYVRKVSPMGTGDDGLECTDFMSVDDCNLMFNVCDPVMCPTSRCDMGGKFPVSDVISTGIVGSIALCLPNFGTPANGGVLIPVCLSGIHAGLDAYVSLLKSHQSCLEHNIESGEYTGVCDEISAIYTCDFFWGQISPLMKNFVPALVSGISGEKQMRGGAEYLTTQVAFNNLEKSVDFFTKNYAESTFEAFKLQNVEEVGTSICKGFVGTSMPTSADLLEGLTKPNSPTQFYAQFSEDVFSKATVPSTSHYKVYYHIYAGNDEGVQYKVYMRNPPESSYYANHQTVQVDSGYIVKGESADRAKDFTAPSGYKELCVSINGRDECGFGKVTSDFGIDYATQMYANDQASVLGITSTDECTSTSMTGLSLDLNAQQSLEKSLGGADIATAGITRICATTNPTQGVVGDNAVYCEGEGVCDSEYHCQPFGNVTSGKSGVCEDNNGNKQISQGRWRDVGYCDNEKVRCWLDTSSVSETLGNFENVLGADSVADIVSYDIDGEYSNVQAELSELKEKIKKLEGEELTKGDSSEFVTEIVKGLDLIIGVGKNPGKGLNSHKAEALLWKASLYRAIARKLMEKDPGLKLIGGKISEKDIEEYIKNAVEEKVVKKSDGDDDDEGEVKEFKIEGNKIMYGGEDTGYTFFESSNGNVAIKDSKTTNVAVVKDGKIDVLSGYENDVVSGSVRLKELEKYEYKGNLKIKKKD